MSLKISIKIYNPKKHTDKSGGDIISDISNGSAKMHGTIDKNMKEADALVSDADDMDDEGDILDAYEDYHNKTRTGDDGAHTDYHVSDSTYIDNVDDAPFMGDTNAREYRGGDEIMADDELDALLSGKTIKRTDKKDLEGFSKDLEIFPQDDLMDLRKKIFLLTGIPIYRQHYFYINKTIYNCGYKFYQSHYLISTDIRKLYDPQEKPAEIEGIPVDMELFYKRDNLAVDTYENMRIVGNELSNGDIVYVTDLNSMLDVPGLASRDKYDQDLLYYGFVMKYFPMITYDVYSEFIANEENMKSLFPELAPRVEQLEQTYKGQEKFLNELAKMKPVKELVSGILRAKIKLPKIGDINIRNVFNILRTRADVPYVFSQMEISGNVYAVERIHKTASGVAPRMKPDFRGVLIVMLCKTMSAPMKIHIAPDGSGYIDAHWHEEDNVQFIDIPREIGALVNPLLSKMGEYKLQIGAEFKPINAANIQYDNIDISFVYKKTIYDSDMVQLARHMRSLRDIEILGDRLTQHGQAREDMEFLLQKGTFEFDPRKIDKLINASLMQYETVKLTNQYEHLTDRFIQQKWQQIYSGKPFIVRNQIAFLQVIFNNLSRDEYENVRSILGKVLVDSKIGTSEGGTTSSSKRTAKLRNEDPELYNLKRHGLETVYARYCQGKMQPEIIPPAERDTMKSSEKKGLTKFWNFTKEKETYYRCPHKEYPYLSFRVAVHPKGYCLPCCKKKPGDTGRGKEIQEKCLNTGKYSSDLRPGIGSHYIMQWSPKAPRDIVRLMHLPGALSEALPEYKIETVLHDPDEADFVIRLSQNGIKIPRVLAKALNKEATYQIIYEHRGQEYNIVATIPDQLTLYFTSNGTQGVQRIFNTSDDSNFNKFLRSITESSDVFDQDETKITLQKVIDTVHEQRGYDIEEVYTYVHEDTAYAALIRTPKKHKFWMTFFPGQLTYTDIEGIKVTTKVPSRRILNAGIAEIQKLIKQINIQGDTDSGMDMYQLLSDKSKCIALVLNQGEYYICTNCAPQKNIAKTRAHWDPLDVSAKIAEEASPNEDPQITEYDQAVYHNYIYRLLLLEFLNKINNEENKKIRKDICDILMRNKKNAIKAIRAIQQYDEISELDKAQISSRVTTQYFEGKPIDTKPIMNDKFQFDRKTLSRLQQMPANKRLIELRKITDKLTKVVRKEPEIEHMRNTLIPCAEKKSDYCDGKRLIITKDDYEEMTNIINDMIDQPFVLDNIIDNIWIENIVNHLKFRNYKDEEVIVRQLS